MKWIFLLFAVMLFVGSFFPIEERHLAFVASWMFFGFFLVLNELEWIRRALMTFDGLMTKGDTIKEDTDVQRSRSQ